jgi:AcrR family transcriptional regulator
VPRLTPELASARRRQILDAAVTCFARDGFHKTTMQDICRRARLSPGAVYCWFESKEEIIDAVASERHAREREILLSALQGSDLAAALHRFVDAYLDWLNKPAEKERRTVAVQVWGEALVNQRLFRSIEKGIGQRVLAFEFIEAAQARGRLTGDIDADALTRVMLALIQGFILQQAWEPNLDIDSYRRAVGLLIDAIAAAA